MKEDDKNPRKMMTPNNMRAVLRQSHMIDLHVRVNGEDRIYEAEWIKRWIDVVETAETILALQEQTEEMNSTEAFWRPLFKLPVSKFVGPLKDGFKRLGVLTRRTYP